VSTGSGEFRVGAVADEKRDARKGDIKSRHGEIVGKPERVLHAEGRKLQ
jgi:hypothetical protein